MKKVVSIVAGVALVGLIGAGQASAGPISDYAKESGVSCVTEIEKIDQYLNAKFPKNGAWSSAATKETDQRLFTALNIKKFKNGTTGYATLTVAPGSEGRCDATLMQMTAFEATSCTKVREEYMKEYEYVTDLAGQSIFSSGGTKAVLQDVGGGCVSMRYEALFPTPK
jgi:hypothetical protein